MAKQTGFEDVGWAAWMEEGLRTMLEIEADRIAVVARGKDGEICSGYWNMRGSDKMVFAGMMQADAMEDMLEDRLEAGEETDEDEE